MNLTELSPTEVVEVCNEKLIALHPICKELEEKLKKVDSEITYWANLKWKELMKILPVRRIPMGKSGRVKAKETDIGALLSALSTTQKEEIVRRLEGGQNA